MDRVRARIFAVVGLVTAAEASACSAARAPASEPAPEPAPAGGPPPSSSVIPPGNRSEFLTESLLVPASSGLTPFVPGPEHPLYVPPRVTAEVEPLVCKKDEVRNLECYAVPREACFAELAPGETLENPLGQFFGGSSISGRRVRDQASQAHPRYTSWLGGVERCCYSSCWPLQPASANPLAYKNDSACFPAPESGTSTPSSPPFQACPTGIVALQTHDQPASFDRALSEQSTSSQGERMCCYSFFTPPPDPSPRLRVIEGRPLLVEGTTRIAGLVPRLSPWA